jgi:hypothetical protein
MASCGLDSKNDLPITASDDPAIAKLCPAFSQLARLIKPDETPPSLLYRLSVSIT